MARRAGVPAAELAHDRLELSAPPVSSYTQAAAGEGRWCRRTIPASSSSSIRMQEDVGADAGNVRLQVAEPLGTEHQLTSDPEAPALADQVEGGAMSPASS